MAANNNGTLPKAFCAASMKATSNGVFQNEDPLDYALPLAILQICLVLLLTRLLAFLLRPLRQPRVVAEIIGGILLGPSGLGRNKEFLNAVFPQKSMTVLDTLANLGLLFFLFLVGLELDPSSLRRTGKTSITIAIAGMVAPFALGIGSSFAFPEITSSTQQSSNTLAFIVFMGVAQSITAFGVLARILAELKLLTTEVGRIAMSAASLNDVAAWILLALAIALSGNDTSPLIALWVLLCGVGFVILCVLIVPPAVNWMARRCPEGEPVDESYVCATLAAVLAAGFATDAIGIHVIFGAFVVGVLFPKGAFADALANKTEDLITGLLLPLYFVSSGLKTDVTTIRGARSWGLLALATTTACFGKIVATISVSLACKVNLKDSVALGLLMNTKGLVELIVLNIGKDRKVLHDQTFAIMVLMALFTTFITTPLVLAFYKPARQMDKANYKHRKVARQDQKTQLRVLSCFHSTRNIPTMLNFIEASRGTDRRQGLCVYAMHLTELTERPSSILMVHKARKNGLPFWNKGKDSVNSDRVVVAFETFRQLSQVSIRPMTAISHMSTFHEDICSSAQRKRVAMIILPFHKHQKSDGSFETTKTEYHSVNKRVLENSPCSVGILIDRGIVENSQIASSSFSMNVTILFFGGDDDQEALAYGVRMAEHPGVNVTVVRFIASIDYKSEAAGIEILEEQETWRSKPSDETVIAEVKNQSDDTNPIKFEEKSVKSPEETVEIIGEYKECNLFLVGRKPEGVIAMSLMMRKSDSPELGPIGNVLISTEVSTSASVLVVQQYTEKVLPGSIGSARVAVAESPEQDNSKSGSSSSY